MNEDDLYSSIEVTEELNLYIPGDFQYWRRVEDELPEDGVDVLLYFPEFRVFQIGHCAHYSSLDWYGSWNESSFILAKKPEPTHWMPLPEKPDLK